ncbi:MAG: ADP-ribosylation factor-directed GTPase activating protein isoform b, partial [Pirellulales bacterium]|nr:ADP-ribosylation factor-directed GTPase activating protein isoform b [Pirellulales bacterium]
EFLAVALPAERLCEPWVLRAAERLVITLEQTADIDIECGALYHAAHGLLLYRDRLYQLR